MMLDLVGFERGVRYITSVIHILLSELIDQSSLYELLTLPLQLLERELILPDGRSFFHGTPEGHIPWILAPGLQCFRKTFVYHLEE
jgi:hypothetical protein